MTGVQTCALPIYTNTNIGTLLEQAITGIGAIAVSGSSNYTLTTANGASDEARNAVLNITGTLTAAINVVCPTSAKTYIVKNGTTGGYAITLKTSGGTGISVPNGSTMLLYCDGTNVVEGLTNIGTFGPGFATYLASPPAIGGTTAAAITGTTINGTTITATTGLAGPHNGTLGATTPNTAVVTSLTASLDSAFTSTGAVQLSSGTTAQRPTGAAGKLRFNSDLTSFEGYNGTAWGSIGGGATGGGTDQMFYLNGVTVNNRDRKSTRLNSSHIPLSRMPSSA